MKRLRLAASFGTGIVFGVGLAVSQMTNPNKVLNFLDVFGDWDPSLALVLLGALGVNLVLFRTILRRAEPAFDAVFHLPNHQQVDRRLVVGSALFGLGWGLSGFCPGAAIAAVSSGMPSAMIFLAAMAGGMGLFHAFDALTRPSPAAVEAAAE